VTNNAEQPSILIRADASQSAAAKFRLVEPGIDLNVLSQSTLAVRRALWAIGERRFPHLRYDFHDDQRMLGTEHW
jgi:hypothetical protein